MGLADELLEDAHHLADKGIADQRNSYMRRSISPAYHAVFHLFVEDFIEHWEFPDQRARLGRMANHGTMCAEFKPANKKNPTPLEKDLKDRKQHSSNLVETDARNSITLAEDVFAKWRKIGREDILARNS